MIEKDAQRMIDMIKCICEDADVSAVDRYNDIKELVETWL